MNWQDVQRRMHRDYEQWFKGLWCGFWLGAAAGTLACLVLIMALKSLAG